MSSRRTPPPPPAPRGRRPRLRRSARLVARTALSARLVAAGAVVVAGAVLGPAGPVTAQTCSAIDRNGTTCNLADQLDPPKPTPGHKVVRSASPPGPKFVWVNLLLACDAAGNAGWTPMTDLSAAILDLSFLAGGPALVEPGVLWVGELVDPVNGGTNSGYISCVGAGQPRPPLPPPLPTADQIWGAALTFEPQVNLDPYVRGLTGLETYMWYEGPTDDNVTITLNGYTVTAAIQAVEFGWDMGGETRNGEQVHHSARAGSPDDPAAEHTYATPGPVMVTHEITWTGTSVLTGPGLPAGGITVDLGQAVLATARDYDVIEVRTPLVRGTDGAGAEPASAGTEANTAEHDHHSR